MIHNCGVLVKQLMGNNSVFLRYKRVLAGGCIRHGHSNILYWINSCPYWSKLFVCIILATRMGSFGKLGEFDPEQGYDWGQYIERLEHYFVANDIQKVTCTDFVSFGEKLDQSRPEYRNRNLDVNKIPSMSAMLKMTSRRPYCWVPAVAKRTSWCATCFHQKSQAIRLFYNWNKPCRIIFTPNTLK